MRDRPSPNELFEEKKNLPTKATLGKSSFTWEDRSGRGSHSASGMWHDSGSAEWTSTHLQSGCPKLGATNNVLRHTTRPSSYDERTLSKKIKQRNIKSNNVKKARYKPDTYSGEAGMSNDIPGPESSASVLRAKRKHQLGDFLADLKRQPPFSCRQVSNPRTPRVPQMKCVCLTW
ncbi:hypothetical protein Tco_0475578 [Tanacetum coccineum]